MMEKYGVDDSDDVEVLAHEMVKTGSAKTLSQAREMISHGEPERDGDAKL